MLKVTNLRYGYRKNPLGTGDRAPRLSWQSESDERCVMQKSYRIQVSKNDPFFMTAVWDTGTVPGGSSLNIGYEGAPLESAT